MVGRTVGKYRIVERLGRGGMGTVYKAIDETLDREVAIKVLNPDLADADLLKRFRAEAVTLARLNHAGIATIYELYRQDEDLLMVMEFVRGETLHQVCERVGPMGPPQAAYICSQVLDALAYAHRAGVVHRDLKPANLMLTETGTVKVMDFGIARVLGGEHLTHGGYMMGTPAYMSPEQVLGRAIDGRSDLYAVGVLFYRLLTGELPFRADTAISMAQKQIADAPTPVSHFRSDLPVWCAAVIERALAKDPDRRFQSADEFRQMLAVSVRPEPLGEMPTRLTPTPPGTLRTAALNGLPATVVMNTPARTSSATARTGAAIAAAAPPSVSAGSGPVDQPRDRTTTTVVLGRTHLAAIAALLLILVAGIAVLAYLALRQSPAAVPGPAAASVAAPATADAAPAEGAPGSGAESSEGGTGSHGGAAGTPPAAGAPLPPAVPPAPGPAPAPPVENRVATVGAGQSAGQRPTLARSAAPADGRSGARGESRAPERGKEMAAVAADTASPAAASAVVTFDDVRVLTTVGSDERGRERAGTLELLPDQLVVKDSSGGSTLATVPYSAVVSAHYSRSRQPKWRDASGKEVESRVDLGRLGFLRSERNWLILVTNGEPVVLRFEDANLQSALAAVSQRTGVRIQR
ncbi:MAG TPA: serine/threonine-protein kinase [Vicinamibacterales bacterium]|nr:serine/threonine-protein kinase [Vicinamibacterales bacterium]